MKKLIDFLKTNKYVTIWTLCYIAVMYLVLIFMFGFNMFSPHDWGILMRAKLRGFPGFVFGILLLAAVPTYIATTAIIIRTKKPLFVLIEKKKPSDKKEEKKVTEEKLEEKPLPAGLPNELRGAFVRARKNIGDRVVSDFEIRDVPDSPVVNAPDPVPDTPLGGLPIPDDFDFGGGSSTESSAPVFREISFGSEPKNDSADPVKSEKKSDLISHLESKNYHIELDGDIVIVNGMAIVTHDDSDFWIADDENWFAAGKQKPSPIAMALAAAKTHNVSPAIYLAEKNIMDMENKASEWEQNGIRVLHNLTDV